MRAWAGPTVGLAVASAIAGVATWGTLQGLERLWGSGNLWVLLGQLVLASGVGVAVFVGLALQLNLPELRLLSDRILQKVRRR